MGEGFWLWDVLNLSIHSQLVDCYETFWYRGCFWWNLLFTAKIPEWTQTITQDSAIRYASLSLIVCYYNPMCLFNRTLAISAISCIDFLVAFLLFYKLRPTTAQKTNRHIIDIIV